MNDKAAGEDPMFLVLLDKHGEPQILFGEWAGPGPADVPPDGGKPRAGSSDDKL